MVVLRSKGKKNRDFYLNLNTESLQRRGAIFFYLTDQKKIFDLKK
jgi:hypothetical protein